MKKIEAIDVANFFLSAMDHDAGDLISNLKMQKLAYYAQGVHLAMFDKPLFDEQIMAWEYGPVVESIYHEFKKFGAKAIEYDLENSQLDIFSKEQREMLEDVYNTFGQFSAWRLKDMTHQEKPWKEATKNGKVKNVAIPQENMKAYFKTQLIE